MAEPKREGRDQGSQGFFSPWLRERRLAAARPHLRGRVLDYGCGGGALAASCEPERYVGVDVNEAVLRLARTRWPRHRFERDLPAGERFDTICALAVIEHVPDPGGLLARLAGCAAPGARLILTTPHPAFGWAHDIGSRIGLFSSDAREEHEALLGKARIEALARPNGWSLARHRRFLGGANQLFVLERVGASPSET
jgi:2-polyprenyl-3-methyl-5-hydroxy-6-metoxy-1,4-benzoquinol methylase